MKRDKARKLVLKSLRDYSRLLDVLAEADSGELSGESYAKEYKRACRVIQIAELYFAEEESFG